MFIRLFFAEKDCSPENFTFDGGKDRTLCFFLKHEDKQMKIFRLWAYEWDDNNKIKIDLGYIYLFFEKEEDYGYLTPGKYQYDWEFLDKTGLYSLGATIKYYKYLKRIKGYKDYLRIFGDIIYSKDISDKFNEKYKKDISHKKELGGIAEYLVEISNVIFKYDKTANYLMLIESEKLYKNNQFAERYKEVYEDFFDKINSVNAANDFLDFLQKNIIDGKGKYSIYERVIKKIEEKYNHESIKKRLLKMDEPVIQAYKIINDIKNFLKVNKEFFQSTKNCLGHYTSMSTLKILLENQKKYIYSQKFSLEDSLNIENASEESTVNCLRLTNSRLMNDPLEGKVITNFLDSSYNQKDFLPSSIYMMCITQNVDNLPMWQQYGVNGTGAFIRLKNEFLEKIVSDSKADIYRVCYLSSNNEVNVNHLNEEEERKLEIKLAKLKNICKELKTKSEDKYPDILSIIQQDISFLFKTADYSYESEYRIVLPIFDNLNFEVKCEMNKDYPFPFLYIYLDDIEYNHSKYSEVIIGPKAIDVDFLGPYINYLDPEIDISVSKIPYR